MIEIQNLVKRYGEIEAVNDISFQVRNGEILGFLGPNGAGKSTTMNILTGYISATSGHVLIDQYDILEQPQLAKKQIGYLPENPPLYFDMTVREYLNFIADLKNVDKKIWRSQLTEILRLVRITDVAHRLIKNLSKGYKQRVGIAQALVGNPDVLILDEPTVGLDPKQIIDIRNTIKELGKNHTIILSSHILPEVSAICDRVIIINHGHLVAEEDIDRLNSRVEDVKNLQLLVEGPARAVVQKLRLIPNVIDAAVTRESGSIATIRLECAQGKDIRRQAFYEMARNSWPILEMKSLDPTLEDIFLQVTGNVDYRSVKQ
ncbi:ATP-binding cassette domain-containing protein [Oscillospiraceae bacterium HV4-5-C5C]|nr:ATP-binding cassette domain-containing protein [Oscillospiraceae bacterium HV4-5-C5C]